MHKQALLHLHTRHVGHSRLDTHLRLLLLLRIVVTTGVMIGVTLTGVMLTGVMLTGVTLTGVTLTAPAVITHVMRLLRTADATIESLRMTVRLATAAMSHRLPRIVMTTVVVVIVVTTATVAHRPHRRIVMTTAVMLHPHTTIGQVIVDVTTAVDVTRPTSLGVIADTIDALQTSADGTSVCA